MVCKLDEAIDKSLINYECALLTARGNTHDDNFNTEEKESYTRQLKAELLVRKYGVKNVRRVSKEQENPQGQEESVFIVNLPNDPNFKDEMAKMAEKYNQDFMYSPKGSTEGLLIDTDIIRDLGLETYDACSINAKHAISLIAGLY